VNSILLSRDFEVELKVQSVAEASATETRGKSLVCCRLTVGVFIIKH
jgi:hypothetical protein